MAPREEISFCHHPAGMLRGEHLGTFTVTGAIALILQFRPSEKEMAHEQDDDVQKFIAHIGLTSGGLAKSIELYGDYVGRQLGLKRSKLTKHLAEVAMEYLNGDKSPSDKSLDSLAAFLSDRLAKNGSSESPTHVLRELIKELDACMVSYFSFHWQHAGHLLDQVRTGQRNLRSIVMAATRKHRFQKAMQTLKAKRAFATLLETLKAMKKAKQFEQMTDRSVREELDMPRRRNPVLMLVGGGMGAGKSTVVKEILRGSSIQCTGPCNVAQCGCSVHYSVAEDAVVVEADAFKETDVLYRSLSSGSGDVSLASQLVHDSSTRAASSLLVSALNEGRDVVFDGTMSWEPFVLQTIAMVRDVHRRRYRLGPGYKHDENGVLVERYWEPVEAEESDIEQAFLDSLESSVDGLQGCGARFLPPLELDTDKLVPRKLPQVGSSRVYNYPDASLPRTMHEVPDASLLRVLPQPCFSCQKGDEEQGERLPYRIVLVGVTCDALLAVVRGIRRAIITNRFVPISAQLRSHKMFAASLEKYCELVDSARIYSTSKMGGSPELIGVKDGAGKLKKLDEQAFETISDLALLNPDASSVLDLYKEKLSQVWTEMVMDPDRPSRQEFLRNILVGNEEDEESTSGSSSPDVSSVYSSSNASSAWNSATCC